jgi:hypothetical protein
MVFQEAWREFQYLPTNIDSKKTRLGKSIWGKMNWCYCEHIRRTHCEPIGNFMGTSWEQKKYKKSNKPGPSPKDFFWICWVHATIFHWLSIICIPNYVFHLFQTFLKMSLFRTFTRTRSFLKIHQWMYLAQPYRSKFQTHLDVIYPFFMAICDHILFLAKEAQCA